VEVSQILRCDVNCFQRAVGNLRCLLTT
jgi:hypothetical protein